jgi:hypothetical protein
MLTIKLIGLPIITTNSRIFIKCSIIWNVLMDFIRTHFLRYLSSLQINPVLVNFIINEVYIKFSVWKKNATV